MSEDTLSFLSAADMQLLLAKARRVAGHRGDVLLAEGTQERSLFLVRKGYVRVERAGPGQGIALARLGPGQVFGEMSLLEETGAVASVIAEEDVEVDVVAGPHLQSLLASDPGFSARFYQSLAVGMAHRLRKAVQSRSAGILQDESGLNRFHRDRTGQITERQMPEALVAAVESFKRTLHGVTQELQGGRVVEAAAQQRVSSACDELREALDRHTRQEILLEIGYDDVLAFRDPDQLALGVGGYVFRETFPLFMASATMAHCYMKPRGYAEDRETLERMVKNEPEGDGRLGPYLDRWFLARPICRARRNSRRKMTALLGQAARPGPEPLRVTSLSLGTAQELFDFLAHTTAPVLATCIDADADALRTTAGIAQDLGCGGRITFLRADVMDLAKGLGRAALGPQGLIYALGLCDYLTDEQVRLLLDWIQDHLEDGGSAILTNLDAGNPDGGFMEHILEWRVLSRTPERFRELLARSRFRDRAATVQADESGASFMVCCRK